MIFGPLRKIPRLADVAPVYASLVAAARAPRFYAEWDVPDTVTGRFDMVSLHLVLWLRRLGAEPAGRDFAQALVDLFFRDMDRSIRELGVSDLGVPKKIKVMVGAFYGLAQALGKALDGEIEGEVETVLENNVFGGSSVGGSSVGAPPLAAYLRAEAARLSREPLSALIEGRRA